MHIWGYCVGCEYEEISRLPQIKVKTIIIVIPKIIDATRAFLFGFLVLLLVGCFVVSVLTVIIPI